jgi:hypothetical protein
VTPAGALVVPGTVIAGPAPDAVVPWAALPALPVVPVVPAGADWPVVPAGVSGGPAVPAGVKVFAPVAGVVVVVALPRVFRYWSIAA